MFSLVIETVARSPHLYAIGAAYWLVVGTALFHRYVRRDRAASEPWLRRILVVGVVAAVAALVDAAFRGPELVHLSLVAYLATPLGIGRLLLARWDGEDQSPWRTLALRETTYLLAFGLFVALSLVVGDPWWFDAPAIDSSSARAVVEGTNWFHLMATAWGLAAVIDGVGTPVQQLGGVGRRLVSGS